MSEARNILDRIRQALTVPAHRPGAHAPAANTPAAALPAPADFRRVLPESGAGFEEHLARFAAHSQALKTDFRSVTSLQELQSQLGALREAEGWKKAASHAGKMTDLACAALELPVCRTDQPFEKTELEQCDVGLTECDALVAQTGSVLLTSRSAGGRALSVLPPHHVVLAHADQLVAGLPEAFALLREKYQDNYPSLISFITGPSRTGDIERILVLGAHGPKKLTVFLLQKPT